MEVASQHCDTAPNKTRDILYTVKIVSIFIGPMYTWGPIIGSPCHYKSFLKPCEDLVKTVNVANIVEA